MKRYVNRVKDEFAAVNKGGDWKMNATLLYASVVLFLYCYFGSFTFFEKTFAGLPDMGYWRIIYHHCMNFVLFFCLGLMFVRFVLKQPLRCYGLDFRRRRLGLLFILAGIPFAALSGLTSVFDDQLRATYPLIDLREYSTWQFVLGYYVSYFLYYIGWEFLFRGLLLNAGRKKLGIMGAILLTTMVSALIHTCIASFGKPMAETLSAIPGGIIFGYMACKTRSMYPSLMVHAMIGFFTDLFIFFL